MEFEKVCKNITKLIDEKHEVIVAADWNIDLKAINMDEINKTQNQKSQNKLLKIMKENLLDKGMKLLNKIDMFHRGEYTSLLDGI